MNWGLKLSEEFQIKSDENQNSKDVTRILIAGLYKAGKSSIALSLKGDNNLMAYLNLRPTLNTQQIRLNESSKSIIILELPGQQKFHEKNLNDLPNYCFNIKKVIFVIDIQEQASYEAAVEYFSSILAKFPVGFKPELLIFLHKFDPNIEKQAGFSDKEINSKLLTPLRTIIPKSLEFQIFKTTIYTIFRKTLME